jgi:bifunctional non-homologous end joining protein LigD
MSKTSDSLQNYHLKRNFRKTSEPRARKVATSKSGDYMIHLHDATHVHYDLRLQWKGVLISWAVPKGPSLNPDDKRLAVRTEDHPDEYKAFEGVIPDQQYGAGPSLIWDAGDFEPLEDFDEGLKKGRLHFRIDGIKLKGEWVLIRMHSKKKDDTKDDTKENWLLKKIEDDFSSRSSRLLEEWPESVVSGRSVADLKDDLKVQTKKRTQKSDPFPTEVFPQLAVRETKLPRGELWQFERKYDGYRLIVLINRGKVSLRRTGHINFLRSRMPSRIFQSNRPFSMGKWCTLIKRARLIFQNCRIFLMRISQFNSSLLFSMRFILKAQALRAIPLTIVVNY